MGAWVIALVSGSLAAGAAVVASPAYEPLNGPVLAGDRVMWLAERPQRAFELRAASAGGRSELIQAFPALPLQFRVFPFAHLAASSDRVALDLVYPSLEAPGAGSEQAFAGPVGSSLSPLSESSCKTNYDVTVYRSIGVSGQSVAYEGPVCHQASVTDFGSPGAPSLRLPDDAFLLRIAGRYVVYAEGPRGLGSVNDPNPVVVFDRVAGREVYRIPTGSVPGNIVGLDVQDDGKILLTYRVIAGHQLNEEVGWASPSQPYVHALLPVSGVYTARLVNDEVVAVRATSPVNDLGSLLLADLRGSTRTLATRAVIPNGILEHFDFDGQRVAWVTRACDGVRINVTGLQGTSGVSRPPRCRLRLDGIGRVIRHRRVRLTFSCVGFAFECETGGVSITSRSASRQHTVVIARSTGGRLSTGTGSFVLTRAGRRLIAHRHRLRVRVTAYIADALAPEQFGHKGYHPERRSTITVLHVG